VRLSAAATAEAEPHVTATEETFYRTCGFTASELSLGSECSAVGFECSVY
jgi:hypothetical protein